MGNLRSLLRNNRVIYSMYKDYKYNQKIKANYVFKNRSQNKQKLCIVLAGYKPFLYESVFGRLAAYLDKDIDVCIISSGKYVDTLDEMCEAKNWSYLSTKENNVSLVQNLAITLHEKAEYIFKLDEDIFITKDYFKKMYDAYKKIEKESDYKIGFLAPLIPINGYGHMRILEKLNKEKLYEEKFEKPLFAAGADRMIENNPEVAKFFWGENGYIPDIDTLNEMFEKEEFSYTACPIRFSIGAILFSRKTFMELGMFEVNRKETAMGKDEEDFCKYCIISSNAIVVCENIVVGHLSFGRQNEPMKEYYLKNTNKFKIKN